MKMNEDEMINQIAAKLTPEEKEFLMDELVGYPRAIESGSGDNINDEWNGEEMEYHLGIISNLNIESEPANGGEQSAFSKAFAKFKKKHPEFIDLDKAWQQEITRLWPLDAELQALYRSRYAYQAVPYPEPTQAGELPSELPKYGVFDSQKFFGTDAVITTLEDHARYEHVSMVNEIREKFVTEWEEKSKGRNRAIIGFKEKWLKKLNGTGTKEKKGGNSKTVKNTG